MIELRPSRAGASLRFSLWRVALATLVAATGLTSGLVAGGVSPVAAAPTTAQLVGQKLVVAMSGTTPSASLLGRISRGEVGGVILFGANVTTAAALKSLDAKLQAAAATGGQPPLLISTDQEGGSIKRLAWAPPTLSVPAMGSSGSTSTASSQGRSTGAVLLCAGINSDLAPVADVPASTASFMYQQGRTWSFSAATTASLSSAFASGLVAGGDVPAMKHFPGIGLATSNTDSSVVTITASKTTLAPGLQPYQAAIGNHIPMIMLSNATYTAYDTANAAGWSHAISVGLLRTTLGFTGVTITDSLTGTASARGVTPTSLAIKAAQAGTDMILVTGSEASTAATYSSLLQAAQAGTIPLATLQASYSRIAALKSTLKAPPADTTAPVERGPASRLYAGSTLGTTTTPVRSSWSATDACGISGYGLGRSDSGGVLAAQALASATSTSIAQSLTTAAIHRYAARATDGAGNTSAWTYGPTIEPLLTQQTSTTIRYTGTWATGYLSSYSGGTARYATAAGAKASLTFTGSSIGWVAAMSPSRGSAKVYVDGVNEGTISLYASALTVRRIVFAFNWATPGTHIVTLVVVGTAGHPRVDVDAFVRLVQP